jgi:hypothetical protein
MGEYGEYARESDESGKTGGFGVVGRRTGDDAVGSSEGIGEEEGNNEDTIA